MYSFVYGDLDFAHKLDEASKPSENYAKHMHPFCEVIYFVKGDALYTVETKTKKLLPDDIVLITPGKFHLAAVNSRVEYERYVFKFPIERLPAFLQKKLTEANCFFGNASKYISTFKQTDHLVQNFSGEELYTMLFLEITKFLIYLCRQQAPPEHQDDGVAADLINFIDDNIRENITLDMLAEHFHYSKTFLCNEFKKYTQMSLIQYVRMKKIVVAHTMIIAGRHKREVAAELGFNEYSTFYRTYKKFIGISDNAID